ncbi:MAG: hypothetical protein WBQ60_02995 [Asticcacaulis sp.]
MSPYLKLSYMLLMAGMALGSAAMAEGVLGSEDAQLNATRPLYRVIPPKVSAEPAAKMPDAPIPYTDYKAKGSGANAKPAETGATGTHKPEAVKPPLPKLAPPLPPPVALEPAPATPDLPPMDLSEQPLSAPPPAPPAMAAASHISLRCETQTTEGKRLISKGSFYIDLFPSPVFPDTMADFQFLFVDPAHDSLIRDSMCIDTLCSANVTVTAYYLLNQVTRKGAALRITLDRTKGAFYAEEIGRNGRKSDGAHRGEQGYCTPQTLPTQLF